MNTNKQNTEAKTLPTDKPAASSTAPIVQIPHVADPIHTSVESEPASTPGYWRILTTAIMMRYGVMEGIRWLRGNKNPNIPDNHSPAYNLRTEKIIDGLNGILSVGITSYYAHKVYVDIRNVFAETIGYEFGKKPSDVTFRDFFRSDNKLVKRTLSNYLKFNLMRYATDALFFLRQVGLKVNSTYVGMAGKGALLTKDIITKRRTFFESTVSFIDHKLNPIHGLADCVDVSELVDLYQKYAQEHAPDLAFKGISNRQMWERSEIVFERMAKLMNDTYRYKHPVRLSSGDQRVPQDFPLPKFLFLLGHGLINPQKIEQSLAYVEVANQYGMEAVKNMRAAMEKGATLESCLAQYPINTSLLTTPSAVPSASNAPVRLSQTTAVQQPLQATWREHVTTPVAETIPQQARQL